MFQVNLIARSAISALLVIEKVALNTGARRGIGIEMVLALTEAGATVYCLDLPLSGTLTGVK